MLKQKLREILISENVIDSINENLDWLLSEVPEIRSMIGFEHNHPHHHLDVWEHTLLALNLSPKDFKIRLVLLLHDIGKPHCYQDLEVRHFKGHPEKSSEMANVILKRLNFDSIEIKEICYLIKMHDNRISEELISSNKLLAKTLFTIQFCDAMAHNPNKLEKRKQYLLLINEKINSGLERELTKHLIINIFNVSNNLEEGESKLVYRLCKEDEIKNVLGGCDFSKLGAVYNLDNMPKVNSHCYEINKPYLHFFKEKNSILYLKEHKGNYLCTYNIPNDILKRYEGIGYYLDLTEYRKFCEISEYAIKSEEILFDYLEKVEYVNSEIEIDGYLEYNGLEPFLELRYEKQPEKKLKR